MRILIDARESGTSTGRYIDSLIAALYKLKSNYQFTVLTKPERVNYIKSVAPSFTVVETSVKEFTFAEQIELKNQITSLTPDLVHFGMTQQPVLYRGKSLTTIHDLTTLRFINPSKNYLIFKSKQLVYRWVTKRVAKKSDKIIVPTEYIKDDLVKFTKISPNKIIVTYEAADKFIKNPEPIKYLTSKVFIMYVGRPQPHKNLDRLIEAFVLLQKSRPELCLVLAGKKDVLYTKIEQDVKKRGIKNIYFTDFVSEGQLRWLYENTSAYLFPSLSEGFGLPGLEAMVHGAPVLSSNLTCLPEVYGDAAIYFNPLSPADIAAKINQVLSDNNLRQELIAKGYKQAEKYSWDKMAKETLAIYNDILN